MKNDEVLKTHGYNGQKIILVGFCLVVFIQPIAIKIFGQDYSIIGYLDDLFFLFALFIVVRYVNQLMEHKYFIYATICYFIFLSLGVISAYHTGFGRSIGQMLLQIIVDLKFLVFMLLFFLFEPNWQIIKVIERIFKIALILGIPLCLLQWISPSLNDSIFYGLGTKYDFQMGNFTFPRLAGIFWGPFLTSFFLSISSFYFLFLSKSRLYAFLSLTQLVLTFERQEIVTFFLLLFLVQYLYRRRLSTKINITFIFLSLLISSLYYMDNLLDYLNTSIASIDLDSLNNVQEPRAVVTWYGFLLAQQYFPLGVGFGNFGGIGALKYDTILYYKLHFDQFWWFGEEDFLTDTYYPHIYAEAGFIGFIFYALCLWFIFRLFYNYLKNFELKGVVTFSIFFLYIVALTSPVLNSPFSLSLIGFIIAATKKYDNEIDSEESTLQPALI